MNGAGLLVESLISAGIDILFGVPGDTGVVFYDALFDRTDRIRHVLARDERHAASMADAYSRTSNRVGVVEVSSGGGTTFVVGGLGESFAAGVPVLVITSDIDASSRGTGALTEIDQIALFSAVTKWSKVVPRAVDIPALVAEAIKEAVSGRPAPVALIVPENVLDEIVETLVVPAVRAEVPYHRTGADEASIDQAVAMLEHAVRPVVVAGSGVHSSSAWENLARFAEKAGVPVASTIHGKGAIADKNPWSLGIVGNNGARPYANEYLRSADLVLFVGSRANATDTNSWTGPRRTGTPVIQIDIDPGRAGRNFEGALGLPGDAREVLRQLTERISSASPADAAAVKERLAASRANWRNDQATSRDLKDGQLAPEEVVRVLNSVLGPSTVILGDPGTPTPHLACHWETEFPGRTVVIPRGHGPMGYAIPAAVGAAFAKPGEPIVSLTTDGSFAMACGELETVARLRLPVLYVQFTNNSLGWIKMLQHLYMDRRYFAVDPGPINAVDVATASGLDAWRVTSIDEFKARVADFARDPKPSYIDVLVPHMIDVLPPVSSWADALSGSTARPVY